MKKSFEANQINVLRIIINEPTAAALTYGLSADTMDKDEKILVFMIMEELARFIINKIVMVFQTVANNWRFKF